MHESSPEKFRQADAIFDQALDLPSEAHGDFVARACGDDEALRAEVERLLLAYRRAGDFLERPAVEVAAALIVDAADARDAHPDQLGPFRIVKEIGHGGMGAVYLGERADGQFAQRVALKRVAVDRSTSSPARAALVRRFLEERRILARLEHPQIARLLDGGVTPDGAPWFAMEYVDGKRLDTWCDERALPVAQRLALFAKVCDAVQYAHQQLVVHRDLKPSNILVTSDGELKLLDFGIAKLLAHSEAIDRSADDPEVTHTATMAMTPQYAAPEQLRGEPVSAATDVYALGVILHELLTGRRPYDLRGKSAVEVERLVCEIEPPVPSATLAPGKDGSPDVEVCARARGTAPDRLRRLLAGDLDAIVQKALRKDAARRYASAAALLDDLRRHREGRPVLARPDGAMYRLRRFVLRQRVAIGLTTAAIAVLAGGFLRERTLRERAEREASKSRAVEEYMVSVFDVSDPYAARRESGAEVTARTLLERGVARVGRDLAGQPEVQAQLRNALGRVYMNLGLYDEAAQQASLALEQRQRLHGARHPDVAEALDRLGKIRTQQQKFDEAESLLRAAVAQQRAFHGPRSAQTAASLDNLATLLQEKGDIAAAEPLYREALSIRRAITKTSSDSLVLSDALNNLGVLLYIKGRFDEAEPLYRESLALSIAGLGESHAMTAMTMQNLAQLQQQRGKPAEAETLFRQALAAKRKALGHLHPSVTISLNNFGNFLAFTRELPDEAEPLVREAIALDRQLFGDRHGYVAAGLNNLSNIERLRGNYAAAVQAASEAVAIAKSIYPGPHKETVSHLSSLASAYFYHGELDRSIATYRESLDMARGVLGDRHATTLMLTATLGRILQEDGDLVESSRLLSLVESQADTTQASQHAPLAVARATRGMILTANGRGAEAVALLTPALAASLRTFGTTHLRTVELRTSLGIALLAAGDTVRAITQLDSAIAWIRPRAKGQPRLFERATATLHLARAPERAP